MVRDGLSGDGEKKNIKKILLLLSAGCVNSDSCGKETV